MKEDLKSINECLDSIEKALGKIEHCIYIASLSLVKNRNRIWVNKNKIERILKSKKGGDK